MDHAGPFDREHRESRNRRRGRNRLGGNEQRAVELRQHHARRGPRDRTRRLHQGRGAGRLRLRHHRNAVQQAGRQQEDAAGEYAAAGFARRRQDPDDAGQRQQTAWLENQHRRLHRNAQILRRRQPVGRDYGQNRDRQIHPARRQLETRLRHETRYGGLPCSRRFRRRRQERRMRTQNRDQRRREGHDGNDRGAADLHHHQPGRRNLHLQGDSQTAGMELCVRQERHRRSDRYPGDLR